MASIQPARHCGWSQIFGIRDPPRSPIRKSWIRINVLIIMRPIRASEIGTYLYCHRAWWYRLKGTQSQNTTELEAGSALHRRHGRKVFAARLLRIVAVILLLAALTLLSATCTARLI